MNRIETLPKNVLCKLNNEIYSLEIRITAWNKLCVCYEKLYPSEDINNSLENTMLSEVVEPDKCGINKVNSVYDIMDVPNFDVALDMLEMRLSNAIQDGIIEIQEL